MTDSPQLVHCHKTERVTIFKIPPLSSSKGFYLDDWKEMIWEGGVKVTQKNKVITVTFIGKDGKIFASTKIPANHNEAIMKTLDSSRGYAVRLENPKGGYLWIGVAFRDRNDAFDFGVVFQDYSDRKKVDQKTLEAQFSENMDFSLKKGIKIKIDVNKKKQQNNTTDFFSDFGSGATQPKQTKNSADTDWFSDFGKTETKKEEKKKPNNDFNLLDL